VPYAVSLVSDQCQAPNNVLKVLNNDADRPPDVDFAVCVTPLNLHYDNVHRLIEFVEVRITAAKCRSGWRRSVVISALASVNILNRH